MERSGTSWLSTEYVVPLVVLLASLLLGGGLGFTMACAVDGQGGETLAQYLTTYLQLASEGTVPIQLWVMLWEQSKLPLCAVLLGFSAVGLVGLPIVLAIRGFSLAYGATCLCRIFGSGGLAVSGVLFGATALITIPALLVMGVQGMQGGYALLRRQGGHRRSPLPYGGDYLLRCGICMFAVVLAVVVEWLVVPALLVSVAPLALT